MGAPTSRGAPTYDFAKFSQKLHEIVRIWMPGGGGGAPKKRSCMSVENEPRAYCCGEEGQQIFGAGRKLFSVGMARFGGGGGVTKHFRGGVAIFCGATAKNLRRVTFFGVDGIIFLWIYEKNCGWFGKNLYGASIAKNRGGVTNFCWVDGKISWSRVENILGVAIFAIPPPKVFATHHKTNLTPHP